MIKESDPVFCSHMIHNVSENGSNKGTGQTGLDPGNRSIFRYCFFGFGR